MKRNQWALALSMLGLWALVVFWAEALHAQGRDCREGSECTAADIVKELFPPPGSKSFGVAPPSLTLKVRFATNSDMILPEYRANLNEFGKALVTAQSSPYHLEIRGHTDNVGSDQYNKRLSKKRAESVRRYLMQNFAIEPGRVKAVGYGKQDPIAPNETSEGRSKNRRVQVINLVQ